jgi:hypothetical protein
MKIIVLCKESKREDKYIKPFAKFYLSSYFPEIKELDIDCPDKNNQRKAPDYFLKQPKIAVEIKGIYDEKEISRAAAASYNVRRLQEALDELACKEQSLNAIYFLEYPWSFKIKKGEEKNIAQRIIDAIKNNQQEFSINDVGIFKIVHKSEDKNKETKIILAASSNLFTSVNPPGTIHQNIEPKIAKANCQLEAKKANKKILLLVNKYIFGARISEFIGALSYSYNNLLRYKNIDEIWLQIKSATNKFIHILLYKKDFLNSFDKGSFKSITENEISLLEEWFYPLSELGDEYKEKLFIALKEFLKDKKPYEVFDNKSAREEMVRLGIWLVEKERFNDVIWIIDKFIDDPDPEEPEKYSGDPKFNYHQQIINGEDPHIITTVLGHLAWVVQKLAVRREYISKALDYTKKLLSHKNLYVKLQAVIPLIEISVRRQWLVGWGKRPREGQYKEFDKTVFDLVNLVKENPNCKAIAKWLCNVFAYYKDLSTKEAEKVLEALKITDEAAGLFIYFGIFRQRHYKDQPLEYDGRKLEEKLKEIIKSDKEDCRRLRASIAWHLWKVLDGNRSEFETIKPYIDLILEQPYQKDIYDDIERIISDWIKIKPDVCLQWYKQMLSKISEFINETKRIPCQGGIWLMYTEEIIESLARYNSDELLEVMEKLIYLWKKGAFIGNLKRLFESFRLVPKEEQRAKVKRNFKKWYDLMKKHNPKIEKISCF